MKHLIIALLMAVPSAFFITSEVLAIPVADRFNVTLPNGDFCSLTRNSRKEPSEQNISLPSGGQYNSIGYPFHYHCLSGNSGIASFSNGFLASGGRQRIWSSLFFASYNGQTIVLEDEGRTGEWSDFRVLD